MPPLELYEKLSALLAASWWLGAGHGVTAWTLTGISEGFAYQLDVISGSTWVLHLNLHRRGGERILRHIRAPSMNQIRQYLTQILALETTTSKKLVRIELPLAIKGIS